MIISQAARLCVAIRDGATTSGEIAERLNAAPNKITMALIAARRVGDIEATGETRNACGKNHPSYVYRLTPKGAIKANEVPSEKIPSWVAAIDVETYRQIARVLDEETAARYARAAKRSIQ